MRNTESKNQTTEPKYTPEDLKNSTDGKILIHAQKKKSLEQILSNITQVKKVYQLDPNIPGYFGVELVDKSKEALAQALNQLNEIKGQKDSGIISAQDDRKYTQDR